MPARAIPTVRSYISEVVTSDFLKAPLNNKPFFYSDARDRRIEDKKNEVYGNHNSSDTHAFFTDIINQFITRKDFLKKVLYGLDIDSRREVIAIAAHLDFANKEHLELFVRMNTELDLLSLMQSLLRVAGEVETTWAQDASTAGASSISTSPPSESENSLLLAAASQEYTSEAESPEDGKLIEYAHQLAVRIYKVFEDEENKEAVNFFRNYESYAQQSILATLPHEMIFELGKKDLSIAKTILNSREIFTILEKQFDVTEHEALANNVFELCMAHYPNMEILEGFNARFATEPEVLAAVSNPRLREKYADYLRAEIFNVKTTSENKEEAKFAKLFFSLKRNQVPTDQNESYKEGLADFLGYVDKISILETADPKKLEDMNALLDSKDAKFKKDMADLLEAGHVRSMLSLAGNDVALFKETLSYFISHIPKSTSLQAIFNQALLEEIFAFIPAASAQGVNHTTEILQAFIDCDALRQTLCTDESLLQQVAEAQHTAPWGEDSVANSAVTVIQQVFFEEADQDNLGAKQRIGARTKALVKTHPDVCKRVYAIPRDNIAVTNVQVLVRQIGAQAVFDILEGQHKQGQDYWVDDQVADILVATEGKVSKKTINRFLNRKRCAGPSGSTDPRSTSRSTFRNILRNKALGKPTKTAKWWMWSSTIHQSRTEGGDVANYYNLPVEQQVRFRKWFESDVVRGALHLAHRIDDLMPNLKQESPKDAKVDPRLERVIVRQDSKLRDELVKRVKNLDKTVKKGSSDWPQHLASYSRYAAAYEWKQSLNASKIIKLFEKINDQEGSFNFDLLTSKGQKDKLFIKARTYIDAGCFSQLCYLIVNDEKLWKKVSTPKKGWFEEDSVTLQKKNTRYTLLSNISPYFLKKLNPGQTFAELADANNLSESEATARKALFQRAMSEDDGLIRDVGDSFSGDPNQKTRLKINYANDVNSVDDFRAKLSDDYYTTLKNRRTRVTTPLPTPQSYSFSVPPTEKKADLALLLNDKTGCRAWELDDWNEAINKAATIEDREGREKLQATLLTRLSENVTADLLLAFLEPAMTAKADNNSDKFNQEIERLKPYVGLFVNAFSTVDSHATKFRQRTLSSDDTVYIGILIELLSKNENTEGEDEADVRLAEQIRAESIRQCVEKMLGEQSPAFMKFFDKNKENLTVLSDYSDWFGPLIFNSNFLNALTAETLSHLVALDGSQFIYNDRTIVGAVSNLEVIAEWVKNAVSVYETNIFIQPYSAHKDLAMKLLSADPAVEIIKKTGALKPLLFSLDEGISKAVKKCLQKDFSLAMQALQEKERLDNELKRSDLPPPPPSSHSIAVQALIDSVETDVVNHLRNSVVTPEVMEAHGFLLLNSKNQDIKILTIKALEGNSKLILALIEGSELSELAQLMKENQDLFLNLLKSDVALNKDYVRKLESTGDQLLSELIYVNPDYIQMSVYAEINAEINKEVCDQMRVMLDQMLLMPKDKFEALFRNKVLRNNIVKYIEISVASDMSLLARIASNPVLLKEIEIQAIVLGNIVDFLKVINSVDLIKNLYEKCPDFSTILRSKGDKAIEEIATVNPDFLQVAFEKGLLTFDLERCLTAVSQHQDVGKQKSIIQLFSDKIFSDLNLLAELFVKPNFSGLSTHIVSQLLVVDGCFEKLQAMDKTNIPALSSLEGASLLQKSEESADQFADKSSLISFVNTETFSLEAAVRLPSFIAGVKAYIEALTVDKLTPEVTAALNKLLQEKQFVAFLKAHLNESNPNSAHLMLKFLDQDLIGQANFVNFYEQICACFKAQPLLFLQSNDESAEAEVTEISLNRLIKLIDLEKEFEEAGDLIFGVIINNPVLLSALADIYALDALPAYIVPQLIKEEGAFEKLYNIEKKTDHSNALEAACLAKLSEKYKADVFSDDDNLIAFVNSDDFSSWRSEKLPSFSEAVNRYITALPASNVNANSITGLLKLLERPRFVGALNDRLKAAGEDEIALIAKLLECGVINQTNFADFRDQIAQCLAGHPEKILISLSEEAETVEETTSSNALVNLYRLEKAFLEASDSGDLESPIFNTIFNTPNLLSAIANIYTQNGYSDLHEHIVSELLQDEARFTDFCTVVEDSHVLKRVCIARFSEKYETVFENTEASLALINSESFKNWHVELPSFVDQVNQYIANLSANDFDAKEVQSALLKLTQFTQFNKALIAKLALAEKDSYPLAVGFLMTGIINDANYTHFRGNISQLLKTDSAQFLDNTEQRDALLLVLYKLEKNHIDSLEQGEVNFERTHSEVFKFIFSNPALALTFVSHADLDDGALEHFFLAFTAVLNQNAVNFLRVFSEDTVFKVSLFKKLEAFKNDPSLNAELFVKLFADENARKALLPPVLVNKVMQRNLLIRSADFPEVSDKVYDALFAEGFNLQISNDELKQMALSNKPLQLCLLKTCKVYGANDGLAILEQTEDQDIIQAVFEADKSDLGYSLVERVGINTLNAEGRNPKIDALLFENDKVDGANASGLKRFFGYKANIPARIAHVKEVLKGSNSLSNLLSANLNNFLPERLHDLVATTYAGFIGEQLGSSRPGSPLQKLSITNTRRAVERGRPPPALPYTSTDSDPATLQF